MNGDERRIVQLLRGEADHCYRWSSGPGARYEVHSHAYRKILYVTEGSITFTPSGQEPVELRSGDRFDIAPGMPHGATVGDDGVVCWEGEARVSHG